MKMKLHETQNDLPEKTLSNQPESRLYGHVVVAHSAVIIEPKAGLR